MWASDVLVGVHGAGLLNGLFMPAGSVVVDLLCPHFTELAFATVIFSAGSHYLFVPNTNLSSGGFGIGGSDPPPLAPPPSACLEGTPTEASALECLAIRNCRLEADVAALEGVVRQAAMLVRNGKRRRPRDVRITDGSWQRGHTAKANPLEPLRDLLGPGLGPPGGIRASSVDVSTGSEEHWAS